MIVERWVPPPHKLQRAFFFSTVPDSPAPCFPSVLEVGGVEETTSGEGDVGENSVDALNEREDMLDVGDFKSSTRDVVDAVVVVDGVVDIGMEDRIAGGRLIEEAMTAEPIPVAAVTDANPEAIVETE